MTPKGEQQAKDVAAVLSQTPHDGIYASSMIRTQQTAQPLADELGMQIVVLPGLREIEAGVFEGQPERDSASNSPAAGRLPRSPAPIRARARVISHVDSSVVWPVSGNHRAAPLSRLQRSASSNTAFADP